MLERAMQPPGDRQSLLGHESGAEFIGLADVLAFVKQYALSIAGFVLFGLIGAAFYIATTDPIFTATTQILIEPKFSQLLQQQSGDVNLSLDTAQIESQIAVMQSEKIATMVINELKLNDDPDFNRPRSPTIVERLQKFELKLEDTAGLRDSRIFQSLRNAVTKFIPWNEEERQEKLSDFERSRLTMAIFRGNLGIKRVGVSYAIEISFRSQDSDAAAEIANATADAFVREQIETKAAAARAGGAWLERRLSELRTQMNMATQVAQEFRAKHDYRVGRQLSAKLVDGQVVVPEGGKDVTTDGPTLEELETTAETYRKMYESFLQALTNSVSQQSYPVADARVITQASPPLSPSHPRKKLVIAFGALAGIVAGFALAFARYTLDRSVRSPDQLRQEFGIDCLGELPLVIGRRGGFGRLDEVLKSPKSAFTRNLRGVKTAISFNENAEPTRCFGITSALPGDGKSSCASNLAMLYAMSGMRTLVIDADVDNSTLTHNLAPASDHSFVPAPDGQESAVRIVTATNQWFDILPSHASAAEGLLVLKNMKDFLAGLQSYDIIIVDLPPFTAGADRLAVGSLLDGVVIAIEWGGTPSDLVGELCRALQVTRTTIFGFVMTKARAVSARRYHRYATRSAR
jgi:uncharacterized protein involved in exopolysaccharide biosynthesis/Mrp family chromosome partitioning ATPase